MFLLLLAKAFGGIWKIRQRYRAAHINMVRKMYSFLHNAALRQNGSWISLSATFGGEPCFPHGIHGIFISGEAIVGKNCVIFQQVTIGSNTLYDSGGRGSPTIGDNCYIGAGAKIVGKIRIGNNVRIGANAFVYQDVNNNSIITCATPRIIQMQKRLNNSFYHKYKGRWEYFDDGAWIQVEETNELDKLDQGFI